VVEVVLHIFILEEMLGFLAVSVQMGYQARTVVAGQLK